MQNLYYTTEMKKVVRDFLEKGIFIHFEFRGETQY